MPANDPRHAKMNARLAARKAAKKAEAARRERNTHPPQYDVRLEMRREFLRRMGY
jgi:hypothetical protein